MSLYKRVGVFVLVSSLVIMGGCTEKIDARQTEDINGLVYKIYDKKPFTGKVKNLKLPQGYPTCVDEAPFKNGVLEGEFVCERNGKKIYEGEFKGGRLHGKHTRWDPETGNIYSVVEWQAGKMDGREDCFNPVNNKRVCQIDWVQGKKEGIQKNWDITGEKLLVDLEWRNGRRTGYLKDGEVEQSYVDETENGVFRRYMYADSEAREQFRAEVARAQAIGAGYFAAENPGYYIQSERTYVNGELDGLARTWGRKDSLVMEILYKNGKKVHQREWSTPGVLRQEKVYNLDNPERSLFDGEEARRDYDINGDLLSEECYNNDCTAINRIFPRENKAASKVQVKSDQEIDACVDRMVKDFRENDEEALVRTDMLDEWRAECAGK